MKYVVALGLALVLNASANLLMKAGMNRVFAAGGLLADGMAGAAARVLGSPVLMLGLAFFALNAGFYMYSLQSPALKISLAYPVMVGGGYAIIATVAYLVLGERMTAGQWAGVAMVLAGVIAIAASTPAGSRP